MKRFQYLRHALGLVWKNARGWTILQIIIVLAQGTLPVAGLLLTRRLVDAAGVFLAQPIGGRDPGTLFALAPLVAAVVLLTWICQALATLVSTIQGERVSDHVQDTLHRKSIEVDLAYFETSSYYNNMRLAQAEAGSRPQSIVRNLAQLGSGAVALIAVGGVIGFSQGLLLPVLLAAALPEALAQIRNSRCWNRWRITQSESQRYAHYLNMLLTTLPFAKEIRLLQIGNELRAQYQRLRKRLRQSRLRLQQNRAVTEFAARVLSGSAMIAGLGLIYLRMRGGTMTLGDLAMLYRGFQKGKSAFASTLNSLAALYEDSLFIGHYYDFMALPVRVHSPARPRPMPKQLEQGIRIEQVAFRYPGTERDVLRDVDVTIRPGEHIALVGENGSGKTTLVKLLCRLYDPSAGRILIDGIDLREFAIEDLRSSYSALFQDFARYQMSAGENVRMGDVSVPVGDPRIAEAAHRAGATEIIERLPHGYQTPLGRIFTRGVELSEGQWQRIALARAFLRPAPLVLLDEPTSALDAKAERHLLDMTLQMCAGQTVIVVSHRLSTVQAADRVVLLADGRIVQTGTHAELINTKGRYAELFNLSTHAAGAEANR